jgi:hypothetical protein
MYYNEEFNYMVVDIPHIAENINNIKRITQLGVEKFKRKFNQSNHSPRNDNITWQFANYNVYGICGCNEWFYNIYRSQIEAIREYFKVSNTEVPHQLWLQSWINSHTPNQVLKSHNHDWPWHGYISIDPKISDTVFTDKPGGKELYRIQNKIGQLYIGPGHRFHHVEVLEPFEGERITFGFDLEFNDRIMDNIGFLPIII